MIGRLCAHRFMVHRAIAHIHLPCRRMHRNRLWLRLMCGITTAARDGTAPVGQQPKKEPISKRMDGRQYGYLLQHTREPQVLADLRAETEWAVPVGARMLVPPEQGAFMAFLVQALGVRRAIEVGVFTGYSSTAVALALPEDGLLVACDRDARAMDIARRCWQRAGVAHKIDERLGQAADTLQQLLDSGQADTFDFAFIDADKRATDAYYDTMLRLVRPGGVIVVDNVLFRGRVADPQDMDKKVIALRDFNAKLLADDRITLSIVPVGDGMAMCRRR